MHPRRSPGEVPFLRHRDEVRQLPELHKSIVPMTISEYICWTDGRGRSTVRGTTNPPEQVIPVTAHTTPSPAGPLLDTHDMVVIHRAFRRESRLLASLIAA